MTSEQRRITLAVCVIAGLSLLVVAGLTFLVTPMSEDLGLDDGEVEDILVIPSVASLLVIFIAGQAGDRLGHRKTIIISGAGFTLGALILAAAPGAVAVDVGLALCGGMAVALQIVGLGLLQQTVPEGKARVSAFTSYGMVFPLGFLILPVATAGLLEAANWRFIPIIWTLSGVVICTVAFTLLRPSESTRPMGEWVTPLLAGLTLTAAARSLVETSHDSPDSPTVIIGVLVSITAAVGCALTMRHSTRSTFTLEPLRSGLLRSLLVGVGIVSLVGMLTYVTIALEYLYALTSLAAAMALIAAQAGAVFGAKFLAAWTMHRWGVSLAARRLMIAIAVTVLLLLAMQSSTPAWYLIASAAVFSCMGMAALTVLNAEVMGHAPHGSTGAISSFRAAASSIGGSLGVAILGTAIISAVSVDDGVGSVSPAQLDQLAAGLRLDAVLACVIATLGWVVLTRAERRYKEVTPT